jgi:excisionase family DNA binding protein
MADYLTVDEVAALMGRSRRWVYLMAESGEIPAARLSAKTLRFRKESLDDWVRLKEQASRKQGG